MRSPNKDDLIRYLLIAATTLLVLVCFLLFFGKVLFEIKQVIRYIGILVSPFIIAWLIAVITRPMNRWLIRRLRICPSWAVLITILLLLVIILGILLIIFVVLASALNAVMDNASLLYGMLTEANDYLNELFVHIDLDVLQVEQYLGRLQSKIADWAELGVGTVFSIAKGTPSAVIWFIVTLVAVFYWCRDEERIVFHLCNIFPRRLRTRVRDSYDKTSVILGGYIRSQVLLVSIAALICTVGMAICGVKSPLVMGIFAGILDIIPIVGPGVVLIGWFIWALLVADYGMALGLAIVYVVVIVSRQILNPKLVGDRVGLHPLLALASIFIGMKLFGMIGLILGPIVVAIVMMVIRGYRGNGRSNQSTVAVATTSGTKTENKEERI